jgi:hypothetical protein
MLQQQQPKAYLPTKLTDEVRNLLNLFPITRDSDFRLIAMYYRRNCPEPVSYITADEFLNHLAHGEMASPDSITRARRKLQQHYPELRGQKWNERQEREPEVREEMRGGI